MAYAHAPSSPALSLASSTCSPPFYQPAPTLPPPPRSPLSTRQRAYASSWSTPHPPSLSFLEEAIPRLADEEEEASWLQASARPISPSQPARPAASDWLAASSPHPNLSSLAEVQEASRPPLLSITSLRYDPLAESAPSPPSNILRRMGEDIAYEGYTPTLRTSRNRHSLRYATSSPIPVRVAPARSPPEPPSSVLSDPPTSSYHGSDPVTDGEPAWTPSRSRGASAWAANKQQERPRGNSDAEPGIVKKKNLPQSARKLMMDWLMSHPDNPYPSEATKREFMAETGLTHTQVNNWFLNSRRRGKFGQERARRLAASTRSTTEDVEEEEEERNS